jgi:peptidoglycan/LPS O-acetylase OafA/YrhL
VPATGLSASPAEPAPVATSTAEVNATVEPSRTVAARLRLPEAAGLRALACLMVLIDHTSEFAANGRPVWWSDPLPVGVDISIVLSGFFLFLPVASAPERFSVWSFMRRRFRRIVPAYYASMVFIVLFPEALVVLWRLIGLQAQWQPIPGPSQWLTHLTFTHTLSPSTWAGINGSYWSLALEAQFYVTMPLVVLAYRRFGISGLAIPGLVSAMWNTALILTSPTRDSSHIAHFLLQANVLGRWLQFLGGSVAAYLLIRLRKKSQTPITRRVAATLCALGASLICLQVIIIHFHATFPFQFMITTFGVGTLLIGATTGHEGRPILARRLLTIRPLQLLATISYSVYLLHQPVEYYFAQILVRAGVQGLPLWGWQLSAGIVPVLLVAYASFRLFEKPFTHERRRRQRAQSTPPASIRSRTPEAIS